MRRRRLVVASGLAVVALCSSLGPVPPGDRPATSSSAPTASGAPTGSDPASDRTDGGDPVLAPAVPGGPEARTTVVPGGTPVDLAAATSAALYERAPVAVLAPDGDPDAQARAAEAAERLGAPLLLTPPPPTPPDPAAETAVEPAAVEDDPGGDGDRGDRDHRTPGDAVAAEVDRLGAVAVLAVGDAAAGWAEDLPDGPAVVEDPDDLPRVRATRRSLDDLLVLVGAGDPAATAVAATARAGGADVLPVAGGDPRADPAAIEALAAAASGGDAPARVLAVGDRFGAPEVLERRLAVAATGVQLPGGGQVLYPHRRMTALYGHPGAPVLGVLGEQPLEASITRAQQLAAGYRDLVPEPVVPAFEIIATVASSAPGPDGNYSNEADVEELRPWVDAAGEAGVYVVLDIQPGRTDFLTQARRYEELLAEPHVGLALDPEWRLGPDQLHMRQIGSVGAAEVNTVVDWLAGLTREHRLPQKLLLLHQFQTRMVTDRHLVDTGHDELAVLVHADGFGTHGQKFATWGRLQVDPPPGLWWGWKNFHDEDRPMMTPAETAAIEPPVYFVSYQ
ncbi:MAG TPA: hypothetical protein VIL36_24310 [Acidimicrobiales bacterium]